MYYTLNTYLKSKYGEKVWKIPVDAGLSCPHKTQENRKSGCIYCNNSSFSTPESGDIPLQVKKRIEKLSVKKNINKFIVYFQSGTNTFGETEEVKNMITSSLVNDNIVGIHIGTRPDCLAEEVLNFLAELNKKYEVVLELGLQSAHDKTLTFINRGHTVRDFSNACSIVAEKGLKICAHVILGLPGESDNETFQTINFLNSHEIHSVKFHHLHIVKNTLMAELYRNGEITLLKEEEYIRLLADSIARLQEKTVISRLVGDAAGDILVAPDWPVNKTDFLNKLNTYMKKHNMYQGKYYKR